MLIKWKWAAALCCVRIHWNFSGMSMNLSQHGKVHCCNINIHTFRYWNFEGILKHSNTSKILNKAIPDRKFSTEWLTKFSIFNHLFLPNGMPFIFRFSPKTCTSITTYDALFTPLSPNSPTCFRVFKIIRDFNINFKPQLFGCPFPLSWRNWLNFISNMSSCQTRVKKNKNIRNELCFKAQAKWKCG